MSHDERAKRRKTFPPADSDSGASDDEAAYQKFLKGKGEGKLKPGNSKWNTCHVELCKTFEQAGTLDRYGIKHLSLWTDLIQDGTLSGCHKEPDGSKYSTVVHAEPLPKRGMSVVCARGQNDVLTNFCPSTRGRAEMGETTAIFHACFPVVCIVPNSQTTFW